MPARRNLVVFVFALATCPAVSASVLFSDDFSYPDGPLVTVSEGIWKTHSGTAGQVEVAAGQLKLSQSKSEDVSVVFPGGLQTPDKAANLYAAFNVNFSELPTGTNGAYFAHFKDAGTTSGLRCRIFATTNGATAGCVRLGIATAASTANVLLERDLQLGTSYRVVCRMSLADNASTLWINPAAESNPGVTSTDEGAVKGATAFAFRQSRASGGGMGELTVDNLKVTTSFVELRMASAPAILTEPASQDSIEGQTVAFRVDATGTEPLSYQWLFNGKEIPGANAPELRLDAVSVTDAGTYQVLIVNEAGSIASAEATLTVEAAALEVRIGRSGDWGIRLSWPAFPHRTYSIWAGDSLAALSLVAQDAWFPEGVGAYEEELGEFVGRFYRISSP